MSKLVSYSVEMVSYSSYLRKTLVSSHLNSLLVVVLWLIEHRNVITYKYWQQTKRSSLDMPDKYDENKKYLARGYCWIQSNAEVLNDRHAYMSFQHVCKCQAKRSKCTAKVKATSCTLWQPPIHIATEPLTLLRVPGVKLTPEEQNPLLLFFFNRSPDKP